MGSNAIRLRIVQVGPQGRNLLEEARLNVRLGLATYGRGSLDAESIAAALGALRTCRDACLRHAVHRFRAVATAALRDAPNRDELTRRIASELGLAIEVIPGTEEARLLYLGLSEAERATGPVAMIELGSGSLQVAAGTGVATHLDCLPMGGLRLALDHGARGAMSAAMLAGLESAVRAGLASTAAALGPLKVRRLLGAGGGFRALAMVSRTSTGAMPDALELAPMQALVRRVAPLELRAREALGLTAERADSIVPAACVAVELMRMLGLERMELVDTNLRDGILTDLAADASRGAPLPA